MKKILFASTALVAFGAAAQAEVIITGNASLGIVNSERGEAGEGAGVSGGTGGDTEFFNDADVDFTLTGETDGGLAFGANVDLDEAGNLGNERDDQGIDVFISGAFGTLTLGDTDGALDWALQEVAFNNGSLNEDETSHAGWNGNSALDGTFDGQVLRYDYSFGDFGVAVSAEIDDNDDDDLDGGDNDAVFGIGARYSLDLGGNTIGFGLGYQQTEIDDDTDLAAVGLPDGDWDVIGLSVNGTFGAFAAGLNYSTFDAPVEGADGDHIGVGVGFESGPFTGSFNYGQYDFEADDADQEGFGLTAGYDLGGGAQIQFGYGNSSFDADGVEDQDSYSFGVRMNF